MTSTELNRVLIANRGEIAIRIAKTATELGLETVSVYSAVDEDSLHTKYSDQTVQIGAADQAIDPYLDAENIVQTALATGCDSIHPGYGFLSESTKLAEACDRNNIVFVGPSAETLSLFGDKLKAREFAQSEGIPVVPGSSGTIASVEEALNIARELRIRFC